MELTDYVKEFRALQKTGKIRVADFCRERMLDYYEMVEALKKDKFLSELPAEEVNAASWKSLTFLVTSHLLMQAPSSRKSRFRLLRI